MSGIGGNPCLPELLLILSLVLHAATAADAATVYKGDLLNTSYYPTRADAANVNKRWYIIDAEGQTLGRLATLAATYIRYTCTAAAQLRSPAV